MGKKRSRLSGQAAKSAAQEVAVDEEEMVVDEGLEGVDGEGYEDDGLDDAGEEELLEGDADGHDGDCDVGDDDVEEEGEEEEDSSDDDNDDEENGGHVEGPVAKKSRGDSKFTPPTEEEMRHLRQTEDLFKSNLLRLEMAELLQEVCVSGVSGGGGDDRAGGAKRPKAVRHLETFLFALRDVLMAMKDQAIPEVPSDTRFPFTPHPQWPCVDAHKAKLKFSAPAAVDVVGSFLTKTLTKPAPTVDVSVEVPASLFGQRAHLNYRYHNRRNAYLAHIHSILSSPEHAGLVKSVRVEAFKGDVRRPVLVLEPKSDAGGVVVRLLPAVRLCDSQEEEGIEHKKLGPQRNNVRRVVHKDGAEPCTPHYSNSILEEACHRPHLAILHAAMNDAPGVRQAVMLLKVWLHQRDMHLAHDTLDGFTASMLAVYLLQQKMLNARMEVLPALMVMFKFLSDTDLTACGPLIIKPSGGTGMQIDADLYKRSFAVALVVEETGVNVAARMSPSAALELRRDATESLTLLQTNSREACQSLFTTRVPFVRSYDYLVHVPATDYPPQPPSEMSPPAAAEEEEGLCDVPLSVYMARRLHGVWTKALGNRAARVRVAMRAVEAGGPEGVWCGVSVDPSHALRLVDRGPPADDAAAAAEFRAFWGSKSELRRFKDGAIVEAVIWGQGGGGRHKIVEEVLRHTLRHHMGHRFGDESSPSYAAVRVVGNDLDPLLDLGIGSGTHTNAATSGLEPEAATKHALDAFEKLAANVRDLPGLPLPVEVVEPLSAALRHTTIFPPLPHPLVHGPGKFLWQAEGQKVSSAIEPLEAQVRFVGSSKWPDELQALRKAKTAFLLQIAKGLDRAGQGEFKCSVSSPEYVDVMTGGLVFRVGICVPKEATLLEQRAAEAGDKATSIEVLLLSRRITRLPIHHRLVLACHATSPLYGRVCRAACVWVNNHLLHPHMPHEAIELMVAWLFARPHPFKPPGSVFNGMIGFLSLLATHDWKASALIVDPHGQMKTQDHEAAHDAFDKLRGPQMQHGPPMVIVAPYDRDRGWLTSWTTHAPERVVLNRAIQLAQRSLAQLQAYVTSPGGQGKLLPAIAPRPHTLHSAFNVIIRIKPDLVGPLSGPYEDGATALEQARKGPKALRCGKLYKNLAGLQMDKRVIGFDPINELLESLIASHGHAALFFMSNLHRDAIGVVFRPRAFLPCSFSAMHTRGLIPVRTTPPPHAHTHTPTSSSSSPSPHQSSALPLMVPNIPEILTELKAAALGVVEDVVVLG